MYFGDHRQVSLLICDSLFELVRVVLKWYQKMVPNRAKRLILSDMNGIVDLRTFGSREKIEVEFLRTLLRKC